MTGRGCTVWQGPGGRGLGDRVKDLSLSPLGSRKGVSGMSRLELCFEKLSLAAQDTRSSKTGLGAIQATRSVTEVGNDEGPEQGGGGDDRSGQV